MTGDMSMAALAVMWWLGRRHAGEQHLKVRDAVKQFPSPPLRASLLRPQLTPPPGSTPGAALTARRTGHPGA